MEPVTLHDELHAVAAEDLTTVIAMLHERRNNLITQRTRTANQLHALFRDLVAGGLAGELTAVTAARTLRSIRPHTIVVEQRKHLAHDLLVDLRHLDRQLRDLDQRLEAAVVEHGTTLTTVGGVGAILAGRLLAHAGPISRFASEAHFASYAGVAPIEASSGEYIRHRLSRAGNRQLNCAIHLVALQQIRHDREGGGDYYRMKIAAGKSPKEAMRCLKRRVASRLYRHMKADQARHLEPSIRAA